MKIIDTVVIIGSLDTTNRLHAQCMVYLDGVFFGRENYVPMTAILEADLVMKARGYSYEERRVSWNALGYKIPSEKVIANSPSSMRAAIDLQEKGMDYFDSLIASLAMELGAKVLTTDQVIKAVVETEWQSTTHP